MPGNIFNGCADTFLRKERQRLHELAEQAVLDARDINKELERRAGIAALDAGSREVEGLLEPAGPT